MRIFGPSVLLLLSVFLVLKCGDWRVRAGAFQDGGGARPVSVCFVTNVAQFRSVPASDYLESCDFKLTGVITLADTNRQLLVLQDTTGAVVTGKETINPGGFLKGMSIATHSKKKPEMVEKL